MNNTIFKYVLLISTILIFIILLHRSDNVIEESGQKKGILDLPRDVPRVAQLRARIAQPISFNNETIFQLKEFSPIFFMTWASCGEQKFLNNNNDSAEKFWDDFKGKSNECDNVAQISQNMRTLPFRNNDETKYGILPVQKSAKNVFVTLGIGQDISAEQAFQKKMKESLQNVTFYGADPIVPGNSELYSKIGKFFPFAVGAKAGFSTASVLWNGNYKDVAVVHVDIYYFLSEILGEKTIDYLWMDAEYAEYGMFDIFYKNSRMDKEGLSFCQMSLEVHNPSKDQKGQFMIFIKNLIKEKQFGFFFSENVSHMRMWLFNFGSQYCVKKFFG